MTVGILREIRRKGRTSLVASETPLPPEWDENVLSILERALPRITDQVRSLPGVVAARAVIQRGVPFGRSNAFLVAVAGESLEDAAAGMDGIISRCRQGLEAEGIVFPLPERKP